MNKGWDRRLAFGLRDLKRGTVPYTEYMFNQLACLFETTLPSLKLTPRQPRGSAIGKCRWFTSFRACISAVIARRQMLRKIYYYSKP